MKRWMILLAVATVAIPALASSDANTTDTNDAYDMTVNMRKLGCALGLSLNQLDEMSASYAHFNEAMKNVGKSDESNRADLTKKAVDENFKTMKYILKPAQYSKYEKLIMQTLANRGIIEK